MTFVDGIIQKLGTSSTPTMGTGSNKDVNISKILETLKISINTSK